jgi:hypothetical protein
MTQYVRIQGPLGGPHQPYTVGNPVPLHPIQGGYAGGGARITNGPSSYSVDPRQIVDWAPTHGQIYGPNVGAPQVSAPMRAPVHPALMLAAFLNAMSNVPRAPYHPARQFSPPAGQWAELLRGLGGFR